MRVEERAAPPRQSMSFRGAVFLGIGAMVGAGIFALLGEAGAIAGAGVWISFLIAGLISGALGYAMARLGVRYPSSGGLITYLTEAFGNGRLVGVASWLGYATAIVVVGAMVAVSFGSYASSVFIGSDASGIWTKVFASAIIVASAALTVVGTHWVDRIQSLIVVGLLGVFAVFIAASLTHLDPHLLAPSGYPPVGKIVSSVALTFFAFLGFAVISFAAGDLERPERDLPRVMYLALGITTILYVAIALSVFGTLTVAEVVKYGPTAIAEAARPALGEAGFACMAVAALLATASSVNATIYASGGLTASLAEVGQFPSIFGRTGRLGKSGGVLITAALTLLFAIFLNLGALASVGSAVSLAVFLLVGLAALRLRDEINAKVWLIFAAIGCSLIVLVVFVVDTLWGDKRAFWTMVGLVAVSLAIDETLRRRRDQARGGQSAIR